MNKEEQFNGLAAYTKGGKLQPYSYKPRPLGKEDVEIEISHCGICGSDIHVINSDWGPTHYPCIVGHEIIGIVKVVGSTVKRVKVGDRVGVGAQCKSCGICAACQSDQEQMCHQMVATYSSQFQDEIGGWSQGGYADKIRVDERFVLPIPENIASVEAAPLLCAGITVFTPLKRFGAEEGKKIGIVGIGGLGHLAIQFAAKMGAQVVAISTSESKRAQTAQMGASDFIVSTQEEQIKKHELTLDLIINTSSGTDANWNTYLSLLKPFGTMVLVGIPEQPMKLQVFPLIKSCLMITGSLIGSPKDIEEMLRFASKHGVRPMINKIAMKNAQDGIDLVCDNKARYRVVLCRNENEV